MLLRDATGAVALQSAASGNGRSGALWSLQDRLGSTIATTTGSGYVTDLADYSDFGIPTHASTGFAGATGFTGEASSPTTGLNSYYARAYDPFAATWLSPDTYRGTMANPASQARYGYVEGNPATHSDHLGFSVLDDYAYAKRTAGPSAGIHTADGWERAIAANPSAKTPSTSTSTHVSARHTQQCISPLGGRSMAVGPSSCNGKPLTAQEKAAQLATAQNVGAFLLGTLFAVLAVLVVAGSAVCAVATAGICLAVIIVAGGAGAFGGSLLETGLDTRNQTADQRLRQATQAGATGLAGAGLVGVGGRLVASAGIRAAEGSAVAAEGATTAPTLTTVGRWMSRAEYDAMVQTGSVQVGTGSKTTYVLSPASPTAFITQAKPASVYVEFDVPTSSLRPAGSPEWAQIPTPDHRIYGPIAQRGGSPLLPTVPACNIVLLASKC